MQLGFVSAVLPDLSLEEVFEFAALVGYDCVEVMCWPPSQADRRYAGVTHLDLSHFTSAVRQRVVDLTARTGVAVSGLGYYPNPLSPRADEAATAVAHLRKVIAAAAELAAVGIGGGRVNTFIGRDWTRSVDDNWPQFLKTWRDLAALAEANDVRIGIENCPMLFGNDEWPGGKNLATSPAIWRRIFDEIPTKHLGLNYDPSHMIWQQMDAIAPLREFATRISHIHAKDARIDREKLNSVGILANPSHYHTPKLPGLGDVNWGQFFSVLGDTGYCGPVCVEVEDRAYEGSVASRKASLVQSHTYLRNFIPRRT